MNGTCPFEFEMLFKSLIAAHRPNFRKGHPHICCVNVLYSSMAIDADGDDDCDGCYIYLALAVIDVDDLHFTIIQHNLCAP